MAVSAAILVSFTVFAIWWAYWVVSQQDAVEQDVGQWPQVCQVVHPEDMR